MTTPVLLIVLDDVGWDLWDEAFTREGGMPYLNRLGGIARRYTNFWAADACSPFRAMLATGLLPHRPENLVGDIIRKSDPPEHELDASYPHMLPQGMIGWTTLRGKHHLAAGNPMHPIQMGYNEWAGSQHNLGPGDHYGWTETSWCPEEGLREQEITEYSTERIAAWVVQDLHRGVGFIHASLNVVHKPFSVPPNYDTDGSHDQCRLAMLQHFDEVFGPIISGAIRANYRVFLACDNGTAKKGKGGVLESGLNTPLWIWGGHRPAGDTDALVSTADLWREIRRLRGCMHITTEDARPLEERDYLSYCDFSPNLEAPASDADMRRVARDLEWKLIDEGAGTSEVLYHLPDETTNVIDQHPERAALLRAELPSVEGAE